MSDAYPLRNGGAICSGGGRADWLHLAAAPTFAVMALLTGVIGEPDVLCAAAHNSWPMGGMVPMYLLMAAFHSEPWLKLIFDRRGRHQQPQNMLTNKSLTLRT